MKLIRTIGHRIQSSMSIDSKMSLLSVAGMILLLSANVLALENTTEAWTWESWVKLLIPCLKKEFNPTYLNFRPLVLPEEQYIYDEWGTTDYERHRPVILRLIVVSEAFKPFSKDDVSRLPVCFFSFCLRSFVSWLKTEKISK